MKPIKQCPSCGGKMYLSRYTCSNCNIEVSGNFGVIETSTNLFDLSEEENDFIRLFLKHEGNIKKVQEYSQMGYTAIKTKLNEINIKLSKGDENNMKDLVTHIPVSKNELPSEHLKTLLNDCGGKALVKMLRGNPMQIWATTEGIRNAFFPALVCEWHIFDAIVVKARQLGGKMFRGDAASQQGKKIGSSAFSLDTIDAYISITFYGNEIGNTTLRRSTYYAAILAWGGIVTNNRSDGEGGYIKLNEKWI